MSGAPERAEGLPPSTLRTDALAARVGRRETRAFFAAFAAEHPSVRSPWTRARKAAIGVGVGTVSIGLLAMAFGAAKTAREAESDAVSQLIGMGVVGAVLLGAGVMLAWWTVRSTLRRGTPRRHLRLARFAADNGMTYQPGPYLGTHLTPWADRGRIVLTRVVRSAAAPRSLEFANYELIHTTASGRNTRFGGYCAVRLSTELPHLVVLARDGRSLVRPEIVPARAQRLSLEGDFDEYFELYCPEGYERDALRIFTPDVMARLIDEVRGFDVEIVDDWLFISSGRDVVTLDPRRWRALVGAVEAVVHRVERWERWRDDRVAHDLDRRPSAVEPGDRAVAGPPPRGRVATRGRRLRTRVSATTMTAIIAGAVLLAAVVVANSIG